MSKVLLITGPGGSGKSTIAELVAKRCGYVYLDGDNEDTEFFPDGDQWLPENTELLRKAHEKILNKTKSFVEQGKSVVVDYIIFGRYLEFIERFRKQFGDDVQVKVLFPSQSELIKRDRERGNWTTGAERIAAVSQEFLAIKDEIGAENFIDTTGQTVGETFERYFSSCLGVNSFNSVQVRKTLDLLLPVIDELRIEYRALGSVVMAAINGTPHRKLGDIDLVIDYAKRELLRQMLLDAGYYDRGGIFKFARRYLSLDTLEHDELLEVGLFAGKFRRDGSFVIGSEKTNISVDAHSVVPHQYQLFGHKIVGLPPEIIAAGIQLSERNPKREQEKKILEAKGIVPVKSDYTHVKVLGIKADWIYYFAMWVLDVIGMARVALGKPYDPWR